MDKALLMFSGGRDSFLSACRLVEDGYCVFMVGYDNGHMSNVDQIKTTSDRIIRKYGTSKAIFVGTKTIFSSFYRFQGPYLDSPISQSCKKYPNIVPSQLLCLACHTGMYIESIAYCKLNKIPFISTGARKSQNFFVELPDMVDRYEHLLKQNGISLILPVYDLKDDWERKLELADRGYVPKVLEPQCWLGCPLRGELGREEIDDLATYYDNEIFPKLQGMIDKRVNECRCIYTRPERNPE